MKSTARADPLHLYMSISQRGESAATTSTGRLKEGCIHPRCVSDCRLVMLLFALQSVRSKLFQIRAQQCGGRSSVVGTPASRWSKYSQILNHIGDSSFVRLGNGQVVGIGRHAVSLLQMERNRYELGTGAPR